MPHHISLPLKQGFVNGITITFHMVKVIVPFYIGIEFLKQTSVLPALGKIFAPYMALLGLPGEAALGLVAGFFVNLYAAIAVIAPLDLPAKDVTIIALILGIAHSLPIETAVTHQTGVNAWVLCAARLVIGLLSGASLNILWKLFS